MLHGNEEVNMLRFYGYFAAAYGTIWFCLMVYAVVARKNVQTGEFGLYRFPVIAFFYALLRSVAARDPDAEIEHLENRIDWLEDQLAEYTGGLAAESLEESDSAAGKAGSQGAVIVVTVILVLLVAGLAIWVFLG